MTTKKVSSTPKSDIELQHDKYEFACNQLGLTCWITRKEGTADKYSAFCEFEVCNEFCVANNVSLTECKQALQRALEDRVRMLTDVAKKIIEDLED